VSSKFWLGDIVSSKEFKGEAKIIDLEFIDNRIGFEYHIRLENGATRFLYGDKLKRVPDCKRKKNLDWTNM